MVRLCLDVLDDDGGRNGVCESEPNNLAVTTPEALKDFLVRNGTGLCRGKNGLGERFSEGLHEDLLISGAR